ncbi:MAG: ATP-dependent RNA helicase HrpA [Desulfobacterales bacterium]|nr:ATP-dependent RNA helicase HrpA [Desulfobacterales bacterium]
MTSINEQIKAISEQLPEAMAVDRMAARREIQDIRLAAKQRIAPAKLRTRCERLALRVAQSVARRRARLGQVLPLAIDARLPICDRAEEIVAAITAHPVVVVAGETGSGKTTQLPKMCIAAGRGVDGTIGLTQPRRIAALTVGRRIAEELGETVGQTVGVKIRFQDTTGADTRIKLMTDGILLAEAQSDSQLNQYDTLIIDEAHERSLNIDFILGLLKQLLVRRRDLKVVITSATIDTEKFAQAFGGAPIIEVSGRMYPVETRYLDHLKDNGEESTHIEQAAKAMDLLHHERRRGDVLIFMPTEQDIRDTCELLQGRRYPSAEVIPLFARLSASEQQRVFRPSQGRRIIVATNVAETSITIPGIRYVIDTGLARISQYTPRTRTNTLPVVPIAQSSADQRQGRCGRVANGLCIRLYSQEDYEQRPKYTLPEILRANLAEVILRMIALGLGDVEAFPFIDPPAPRSIQDGYALLLELGAIVPAKRRQDREGKFALTAKGRLMARLPLDPRLACMLLTAHQRDCLADVAVIAAALSIQDPRERPGERQAEADAAHARFADPASDFLTLLRIWHAYDQTAARRTSWQQVKQFCHQHFLSFRRMREWRDVHGQILGELAENDIKPSRPSAAPDVPGDIGHSGYAAIHQSILSGFLSNIAMKKEKQIFQAAYARQAMIFPGSGLFKNPGQWIVAAEMVETSRLFARCAAVIDPAWIEPIGKEQCKYTHLDPHWERRREAVVATEQVSLYGLIIDRRTRPYGPFHPDEATEIFIRKALIEGDVARPPAFMQHNQRMIAQVEEMQDRLRRKDLLVDEQRLFEFYQERLGEVYDLRGLKLKIAQAGNDDFLRLKEADLLSQQPDDQALSQFPDRIDADGRPLPCDYRFAPGEENDGVTVRVAARAAGAVPAEAFQWLVPGLLKEKIAALIKSLPKELRKRLVPVNETVETIASQMPVQRHVALSTALSRFIRERWGLTIPAAAWNETQLPDHLRMRIAVTDDDGRVVRAARDAAVLQSEAPAEASQAFEKARRAWESGPIAQWNFGDLPETILLKGPGRREWTAYPALEARAQEIFLTAFADITQARQTHPQGVRGLLQKRLGAELKYLRKNLALPYDLDAHCRYFGGRPALEGRLVERVLDDHLARDIRAAADFEAWLEAIHKGNMAAWGQGLRQSLLDVLETYQAARLRLLELEKAHLRNAALKSLLDDLRAGLEKLVPEDFIKRYAAERLPHLPRYTRAVALRAERAAVDLEKDRAKAQKAAVYETHVERLTQELMPQSSAEKCRALEELFWMVEEYKISIFAPEIKTAQPVSAKRLDALVAAVEALG